MDSVSLYRLLGKKGFEAHIRGLIETKHIDCVFVICPSADFDPDFYASLPAFVVIKFFDVAFDFDTRDKYYAQAADLVLTADSYVAEAKFAELGIEAMCVFTFYDAHAYPSKAISKKTVDLSFVGELKKMKGKRNQYLELLREKGLETSLYGAGSPNGRISFEDMLKLFGNTKINLNFTGVTAPKGAPLNERVRQCKGRPIEAALCYGFTLSEYVPGIEHMFEIGKEIDTFDSAEELVDKIQYYLAHNKEREAMAKRAHERAVRDYDTRSGFAKVFARITSMREKKKEKVVYKDDTLLNTYAHYRMQYLLYFMDNGQWGYAYQELKALFPHKKILIRKILERIKIALTRS